jgi:hypothetical protein
MRGHSILELIVRLGLAIFALQILSTRARNSVRRVPDRQSVEDTASSNDAKLVYADRLFLVGQVLLVLGLFPLLIIRQSWGAGWHALFVVLLVVGFVIAGTGAFWRRSVQDPAKTPEGGTIKPE